MKPRESGAPTIPDVHDDGGRCVLSATGAGFSVPGLIEFLGRSGKSGTLRLATEKDTFTLQLLDGQLVHAVCDYRPAEERLGAILLARRAVRPDEISRFMELCQAGQNPDGVKLGKLLEQESMVTTEDLQAALADQVRSLFGRLFADAGSWFAFYEGLPAFPSRHVRLDLMDLLVKCARAHEQG